MDIAALAKLAEIGAGLTGPDGETLQDVQAAKAEEEAAREVLRERLRKAFNKIVSAEGSIIDLTSRGHGGERELNAQLDGIPARRRALLAKFDASSAPEELVLRTENEAEKAEQEVTSMRRRIRDGQ